MANKTAPALMLRAGDRVELERLVRSGTVAAATAQRARIVLLAADGVGNQVIAETVGVSRPTVNLWRSRYTDKGMAGLVDEPRPGRPRQVDRAAILAATLLPPPASLGVTHWSSRLLAPRLGVDHATVAAVWKEYGVKPWKAETFKFSTDPELVAKVTDVVGLYLAPPEDAIVLCVDEKSQIQALDRTQKTLPVQPGHAEQRTHDYVRHGTTTLFAALEIATGKVTGLCKDRHRHQEFLAFLKHVARTYPGRELHLVMDNYATHKKAEVRDWLAANPRIHVHFTPTSGSWLNLVEVWFGIIERQAIRRGTFTSVRDLTGKIRAFITGWNRRKHPFIWTKTPDEILDSIDRKRKHVSPTRHYMEMPPYRMPKASTVWHAVWDACAAFLRKMSTIILGATVVMWLLLSLPMPSAQRLQDAGVDPADQTAVATYTLNHSAAAALGKAIEPVFEPLGFDWRINIGIISAVSARETFVSTMGQVAAASDPADPGTALHRMTVDDGPRAGEPLFTAPVVAALMVFFMFALQCLSTMAVMRRETGTWKWPLIAWGYMFVLAWVFAFLTRLVVGALV